MGYKDHPEVKGVIDQITDAVKEANYVNSQTPQRIRNHKVWYYSDGSICRIDPIGAGYGTGVAKGTCFTLDAVLATIKP